MSRTRNAILLGGLMIATAGPVAAQETKQHLIPQSVQNSQKETEEQLTVLSRHKGPVGAAAKTALELYQRHAAREREFILPPLTLLPYLADGGVTPDMAWALPMVERTRAERETLFQEHEKITDALNDLAAAAQKAHHRDAMAFAENAAADSLTDLEVLEPTLLLIGDILRAKLPAAR
jgi:hypothetical protein